MERKIAKLLAFTGVAISAAMALTPLTSYAIVNQHGYNCDPSNPSTLTNADGWGIGNDTTGGCASQTSGAKPVTLNVESQISLDAVSGTIINVTPHVLGTGEISATVSSSHPYTISLSSGQPNLTNTTNGALNIPAKSSFTKDDNAWGIKNRTRAIILPSPQPQSSTIPARLQRVPLPQSLKSVSPLMSKPPLVLIKPTL